MMTAIERALIFVRALVLSRLLHPREFGLMGMAFIAINVAEVLSRTGFARAIIQRREDPKPFLDTVWIVGVARGFLLAGAIFGIAPLLSLYFKSPEATPVLRMVSLVMILRGFVSPAWILLERQLKLRRFAIPRTVGASVDLIVTCMLAFQLRSVWAMVIGFLCGSGVMVCVTYMAGPYVPRLRFSFVQARQLYSFGKHIFRYELLTAFCRQVDKLTVGRLRDATNLGFYSFASRMAALPTSMFSMIVLRVVFPTFARIQQEPERIKGAYERLMGLTAITSFPVAAGLLATAPELVPVVFGERWSPMTVTFQILCLMGATNALEKSCGTVSGGIGQPRLPVHASLIQLFLMALLVVPATQRYGIEGAALAAVTGALVSTSYLVLRVSRGVGARVRGLLVVFAVQTLACGVMIATVAVFRAWMSLQPSVKSLAMLVLVGFISYLVVALPLDRMNDSAMLNVFLRIMRSR